MPRPSGVLSECRWHFRRYSGTMFRIIRASLQVPIKKESYHHPFRHDYCPTAFSVGSILGLARAGTSVSERASGAAGGRQVLSGQVRRCTRSRKYAWRRRKFAEHVEESKLRGEKPAQCSGQRLGRASAQLQALRPFCLWGRAWVWRRSPIRTCAQLLPDSII